MPSIVVEIQMLDQLASELAVVKSTRQPDQAQVSLLLFQKGRQTLYPTSAFKPQFRE